MPRFRRLSGPQETEHAGAFFAGRLETGNFQNNERLDMHFNGAEPELSGVYGGLESGNNHGIKF